MRTWGELRGLTRDTLRLWWRFLARLLLFFWAGAAIHRIALQTAAGFGGNARVTATAFFALALVATAASTILMIHTLAPGLREFRSRMRQFATTPPPAPLPGAAVEPVIPAEVAAWRTGMQTLAIAIGPFLAIASVWGMVEQEVRTLLVVNAKNYGATAVDAWSIDLRDVRFLVTLAVVTFVLRGLVLRYAAARRRRDPHHAHSEAGMGTSFLSVYFEGAYVYLFFVVAGILVGSVLQWLGRRAVTGWFASGWQWMVGHLPVILDLDLPDLVARLGRWVVEVLAPATSAGVLLPLLWLALTATVFGWRDLRLRDLAALPRVARYTSRLRPDGTLPLTGRLVKMATSDLRTKYLPVLTSLRMLLRAGPRLLGAYLVLATVIAVLGQVLQRLAWIAVGPVDVDRWSQWAPFVEIAAATVTTPLLVCLYAATFDRCLALVPAESLRSRLRVRSTLR